MIKTVVIPQNNDIHLSVPNSYIGKEIEVLLYSLEEVNDSKKNKPGNAGRFRGLLTKEGRGKIRPILKTSPKRMGPRYLIDSNVPLPPSFTTLL